MNNDEKKNKDTENGKKKHDAAGISFGISIGLAFGVAFGLIFDNLTMGISLGLVFGIAIGSAFDTTKKRNSLEQDNPENPNDENSEE